MPIFSLSPSVEVKEQDLTLIVPAVATSIGSFVGAFQWGPVDEINIVDSEQTLVANYGKPNDDTAVDFLIASNFLSYTNHLKLVRVVGSAATNAYDGGSTAPLVKNEVDYAAKESGFTGINFIAKYPGKLGNGLIVSLADAGSFADWEYRDQFGAAISTTKVAAITTGLAVVTFSGANTTANLVAGMSVTGTGIPAGAKILSVDSSTQVTLTANASATNASVSLTFTTYNGIPGTSAYVESHGGSNDEVHVVIVDGTGEWTGQAGTVLERYTGLSKAVDAKDYTGGTAYYAEVLNRSSRYVWFGGTHPEVNWGGTSATTFSSLASAVEATLAGGVDANAVTPGDRISGYGLFASVEDVDVNLVIGPGLASEDDQALVCSYILDNIAKTRMDCVALVSPPLESVVANTGNEIQALLNFRNRLGSNSYGVLDSGWKWQYDRYNDKYRWVPLCADVAGLCAHTDRVADAWWSPAGLNRGNIKNVIKLAYNPATKAERDTLYVNNINPVVNFRGEGVVLFGDKTLQTKPSAFDRINVRRLFIILEKAIASAAKYQLFEFNDSFTRARFVAMVTPFLRSVQGRRGLTSFKVICDTSNNTQEVIDSNGFVGDIYVAPNRSINFIQLNFVASPTGVNFEELGG